MLYYIKGEISDVKAMEMTIVSRQTLLKTVNALFQKRQTVIQELKEKIDGSISLSISTFKTLFKN
jgi:hypothetical protein